MLKESPEVNIRYREQQKDKTRTITTSIGKQVSFKRDSRSEQEHRVCEESVHFVSCGRGFKLNTVSTQPQKQPQRIVCHPRYQSPGQLSHCSSVSYHHLCPTHTT